MSLGTIMQIGNVYKIEFSFRPSINEAVKQLPERKFIYAEKYWTVPVMYKTAVKAFAEKHKLDFSEETGIEPETDFVIPPLPELTIDIPTNRPMLPWQPGGVAYAMEKQRLIMGDDMGLGKEQPLSAKILTGDGWLTMGEMKKGMLISSTSGYLTEVSGVFPQGNKQVFKVTFSDGSSTRCGEDHLWKITTPTRKKRGYAYMVKSLREIMQLGLKEKSGNSKFYIPITKPVHFKERNLEIHPYLLGVLLGDGGLTSSYARLTNPEQFIIDKVSCLLPYNVRIKPSGNTQITYDLTKDKGAQSDPNPLTVFLRNYGLMGGKSETKFIPEDYLFNTIENRIQMLHGLMDTDGYCNQGKAKNGNCVQYCTTSNKLCDDIIFLVQSLGGVARKYRKENDHLGAWIITLNLPNDIKPFSLPRKAELVNKRTKYFPTRAIVAIEPDGVEECQCIAVDADDHCYITDDCVVTHNTSQAIIAMEGLHMTGRAAYPCLIICPSAVKENWVLEIKANVKRTGIVLKDSVKNTYPEFFRVGMSQYFICNFESLKKYFVDRIDTPEPGKKLRINNIHFKQKYLDFFKAVIVDESHKVKALTSQNTKFTKGICTGKETIFLLTGTPIVNKPKDLVSQLGILNRLGDFGGYKYFEKRYCSGPKEASNMKELNYKLNLICFYRRNKTDPDIKKFLPDKARQVIQCELDPEHRREYGHAQADLESYMVNIKKQSDEQVAKSMKGEVMVRIGILKNISARGKLKDAFSFIQDIIDNGQKIVVFASLKDVIAKVQEKFPRSVRVTGAEDGKQKQAAVDAFQNDPKIQVIVLNLKAGGVGINGLQNVATQICFIEFGWHAAIMDQAEDRLYRTGQHANVMCTYFLGKNTIDEWNYKLINSKREIANTVTGNIDTTEETLIDSVITLFSKQ
jgi:SWI/SNF-related matrix-associated actin-dependent regulator 1 of chromatin subfamily A